jgi:hypothetical protein
MGIRKIAKIMHLPVSKARITAIIIAASLGASALGGCSMIPEEWKQWLLESPDQQEEDYLYGWDEPDPSTDREPLVEPDWTQQSWAEGAPVTYLPEPLVEEEARREPIGPVVNSPSLMSRPSFLAIS